MADDQYRVDLYEILGLEAGADEKEVTRAYRKQSLRHHPDRGGDVKKFHELKHARDILLDPKKKSDYDKKLSQELMARKRQREREAELDGKRRKMREDFLRKEEGASSRQQQERDETRRRQELSKLREQTAALARQREQQASQSRQAKRHSEADADNVDGEKGSKSQRTVTLKWDRRQVSHSDDSLIRAMRPYGKVESVKLKSSSAKVVFVDRRAAAQAVRIEGHSAAWREVSLLGHIVDDDAVESHSVEEDEEAANVLPSGSISLQAHLDFEKLVLQRLRERIEQHRASVATAT